MELKSIKESLKQRFKLTEKTTIYLIIASLAVILLIFMNGFESDETEEISDDYVVPNVDTQFSDSLCKQLEEIVSKIEGVGDVSVMLTMEGSSSIVYVEDIEKADLEKKTETVIIGNKEALIERIDCPKVKGVLVVCTGGEDINVKEKVINAVSTVLNISSNRVYVTNSTKER